VWPPHRNQCPLWSKKDIGARRYDVRFTPESGHWDHYGRRRSIACGAPHEDIQNARRIIGQGKGWIERLEQALKSGAVLPATAAAVLGTSAFTVTSSAGNSSRAAADPFAELVLLDLCVWRPVKATAAREDVLNNHGSLLQDFGR